MINRTLESKIQNVLNKKKAIIILGARQVGKTTLLHLLFDKFQNVLWLSGDSPDIISLFESANADRFRLFFGKNQIIIIDEAQRIPDIGLRLKLIIDNIPNIQLITTGSSAFELSNKLNEPLTGRKWEFKLYPMAFSELVSQNGLLSERRLINHRLLYGYYPDVVNNPGDEKQILKQLTDSYLYKDILMLENVKKPEKLVKLLQALAYQVGNQVSYNELAQICGMDNKTIEKYITLLEQAFVIFRLGSFSRNLRNELRFSRKIYFYDNGVRNALISNFEIPENRTDIGALWENFLVSERLKLNEYTDNWVNSWFWRTSEQKEIDYLEESNEKLHAYEFKWNPNSKAKITKSFSKAYPQAIIKVIHRENFEEFLLS